MDIIPLCRTLKVHVVKLQLYEGEISREDLQALPPTDNWMAVQMLLQNKASRDKSSRKDSSCERTRVCVRERESI